MNRREFSTYVSRIDPKYVAEAVTYPAVSRSKIKIIAIAACIAVLAVTISLGIVLNSKAPHPQSTTNPVIYNIYFEDTVSTSTDFQEFIKDITANRDDIKVLNYNEYMPLKQSYTETVMSTPPAEIDFTVLENTLKFVYKASYNCDIGASSKVNDAYHLYTAEDQSTLKISATDGTVIEYRSATAAFKTEGSVSAEEAQIIATKTLKHLYGDNVFVEYSDSVHEVSATSGYYAFVNFKTMYGHRTSERAFIMINRSGEIISVGISYYNMYDSVKHIYTEDMVKKAEDKLISLLPKDAEITITSLIFNEECQLLLRVSFKSENKKCSTSAIIDIK